MPADWMQLYKQDNADADTYAFFSSFTVSGCVGVLRKWIEGGMVVSTERLAKMIEGMTLYGIGMLNTDKPTWSCTVRPANYQRKGGACMKTFRFATAQDAQAILDIYRPYVEQTAITFECTLPTLEEFARRIEGIIEEYPYIVAKKTGR